MAEAQKALGDNDPYRTKTQGRRRESYVNSPLNRRGGLSSAPTRNEAYPSIDEVFKAKAHEDKIIQPTLNSKTRSRPPAEERDSSIKELRQMARGTTRAISPKTITSLKNPLLSIGAGGGINAIATRVTIRQFAWNCPYWLGVQLPLAMVCTVAFGLVGIVEAATSTWVGQLVAGVVGGLGRVLEYVGINLSMFNPTNLFLVLLFGLAALNLLVFLITTLIYMISQLHPLSGKGLAFKYGAVIIAMVGYSMPLLNLFPWIFIYILVVWRYPR